MSCSSTKSPMVSPKVGVDLDGFAVTTEPGWFIVNGTQNGVILNKKTIMEISEVGWALTGDAPPSQSLEKILTWIKSEKIADANRDRMENISNNFLLKKVNGLSCFSYKQTARDKNVNKLISVLGLACLHPKRTGHYVDLNLTQRYDSGTKPFDHGAEAAKFFKSLKAR